MPTTPSTPAPSGDLSGLERDGVKIIDRDGAARDCTEFEVTNHEPEPFTYTITFIVRSESGAALSHPEQTVPSVKPGQTIRRTVALGESPDAAHDPARIQIHKVRSVPADEAPSQGGACPPSGVRVYADDGSAAMGLRAVGLRLVNCGTDTVRLNGYPQLEILDERHRRVDSVKVLDGGSAIAGGTGADGVPQPLVLETGEGAYAVLVWRNTVEAVGDPVHAPYVRVRAEPGAAPVTVVPELDLGTTGKLGVGPWKKDETHQPTTGEVPSTSSPST